MLHRDADMPANQPAGQLASQRAGRPSALIAAAVHVPPVYVPDFRSILLPLLISPSPLYASSSSSPLLSPSSVRSSSSSRSPLPGMRPLECLYSIRTSGTCSSSQASLCDPVPDWSSAPVLRRAAGSTLCFGEAGGRILVYREPSHSCGGGMCGSQRQDSFNYPYINIALFPFTEPLVTQCLTCLRGGGK